MKNQIERLAFSKSRQILCFSKRNGDTCINLCWGNYPSMVLGSIFWSWFCSTLFRILNEIIFKENHYELTEPLRVSGAADEWVSREPPLCSGSRRNSFTSIPPAGLSVHNAKMAPPKISFGIKCNHIAIRISDYYAASIEGAAAKHVHKDFQYDFKERF